MEGVTALEHSAHSSPPVLHLLHACRANILLILPSVIYITYNIQILQHPDQARASGAATLPLSFTDPPHAPPPTLLTAVRFQLQLHSGRLPLRRRRVDVRLGRPARRRLVLVDAPRRRVEGADAWLLRSILVSKTPL